MADRCLSHIYCHGIDKMQYLFENLPGEAIIRIPVRKIIEHTPFNSRNVQIKLKIYLNEIGHSIWKSRIISSRRPRSCETILHTITTTSWTFCLISKSSTYSLGKMIVSGVMLFCPRGWRFHPAKGIKECESMCKSQVPTIRHRHARNLVATWWSLWRFLEGTSLTKSS